MALGKYPVFDPFSWLQFPVYTDNHSPLYLHSLTLLKHFLITEIRLRVSEQGPNPRLCASDPALTDPSEHLTSCLGMLMVAAVPDKPRGDGSLLPGLAHLLFPRRQMQETHLAQAPASQGQQPRGQRSVQDMPRCLCCSFTCIRGFLGLGFGFCGFFFCLLLSS